MDEVEPTDGAIIAVRRLLLELGEDPDREGLLETPARYLKALRYLTQGYKQDPTEVLKTFKDGAKDYDELVFQGQIPVWSLCEHHMLPFFGAAHVGYIPDGKVVGLSKIARLVNVFARRLQVQERLTVQIAKALDDHLNPLGVGVILECRHACMECRGVERSAVTVTSALLGAIRTTARAEFLAFVNSGRKDLL